MKSKKPFTWSYSRLKDFETCPAKRGFALAGHKEPPHPASDRGIEIHSKAEKYLRDGGRLPKELNLFKDGFKKLRKLEAVPEAQWGFDRRWRLLPDWFDERVWFRAKLDEYHLTPVDGNRKFVIDVIDFKTGRVRPYDEQLSVYALASMASMTPPKSQGEVSIIGARVQLWFLDHGVVEPVKPKLVKISSLQALKNEFEVRARRMERETAFRPKPGASCKYCGFSQRKGGPCKY